MTHQKPIAELLCSVFMVAGIISLSTSAISQDQAYLNSLSRVGIQPDFDSIKKYFDDLKPSEKKLSRVRNLIRQLSSDDFHQREEAMYSLVAFPALPRSALTKFISSSDMEVNWRIKQVLRKSSAQKDEIYSAVLKAVDEKKIKGLYSAISDSIIEFDIKKHERQLHTALANTFTEKDLKTAESGQLGARQGARDAR